MWGWGFLEHLGVCNLHLGLLRALGVIVRNWGVPEHEVGGVPCLLSLHSRAKHSVSQASTTCFSVWHFPHFDDKLHLIRRWCGKSPLLN